MPLEPRMATVSTSARRPWLAVLLAFVYPGLGHVYLREWGRALLWFGLAIGAVLLLVPAPATDAGAGLDALLTGQRIPLAAVLALATITGFSMLDAYRLAVGQRSADGNRCPSCGRELDESLEFCHWCTERVEDPSIDEA